LKTQINQNLRTRQAKSTISDRSLVRRELKQLQRYEAQESGLLSLGQYAISYVHLVNQTTQFLGSCFYKAKTMAKMLGCSSRTIQRKEQAIKGMGIVTMKVIKKKGYKKVTVRSVSNFFDVGRLLRILSFTIRGIVTKFSTNVVRLSKEVYYYQKHDQENYDSKAKWEIGYVDDHPNDPNVSVSLFDEIFLEHKGDKS